MDEIVVVCSRLVARLTLAQQMAHQRRCDPAVRARVTETGRLHGIAFQAMVAARRFVNDHPRAFAAAFDSMQNRLESALARAHGRLY